MCFSRSDVRQHDSVWASIIYNLLPQHVKRRRLAFCQVADVSDAIRKSLPMDFSKKTCWRPATCETAQFNNVFSPGNRIRRFWLLNVLDCDLEHLPKACSWRVWLGSGCSLSDQTWCCNYCERLTADISRLLKRHLQLRVISLIHIAKQVNITAEQRYSQKYKFNIGM